MTWRSFSWLAGEFICREFFSCDKCCSSPFGPENVTRFDLWSQSCHAALKSVGMGWEFCDASLKATSICHCAIHCIVSLPTTGGLKDNGKQKFKHYYSTMYFSVKWTVQMGGTYPSGFAIPKVSIFYKQTCFFRTLGQAPESNSQNSKKSVDPVIRRTPPMPPYHFKAGSQTEQNWPCFQGERNGVLSLPINHSNISQLSASVSSCMQKWADSAFLRLLFQKWLWPDVVWAAFQNDAVGWIYGPRRKHLPWLYLVGNYRVIRESLPYGQ